MTLEGANNFFENNDFVMYTMNSPQTGQYCAVIPKNFGTAVSMLVDINKKALFDSLISNAITKEQLVEKLEEEYKIIGNTYSGSVLVFPMLDINMLASAVNSGDKQKMFDETKKIGGITSELYKKLTESGVDKSKVSQKIVIVENNDIDVKFVDWLKGQMPNFVDGVSLEELKAKASAPAQASNPFASVNPFTGEAENVSPQPTNDIFGPSPVNNVESPVVESKPNDTFDIFGSQEPAVQPQPEVVVSEAPVAPVVEPVASVMENANSFDPQPVQSVSLNNDPFGNQTPVATTAPTSQPTEVPAQPQPTAPVVEDTQVEVNELDKKSGGFANLLILVVILIGVTIVSIELGKYLYNTFGA